MARITKVLKPTSSTPQILNQINDAFRIINQENRFEVVMQGEVELPNNVVTSTGAGYFADDNSVEVTHNFGYIPTVFAYIAGTDGSGNPIQQPLNYVQSNTTAGLVDFYVWDITVISKRDVVVFRSAATMHTTANAGDVSFNGDTIKYFFLRETAGT